MFATIAKLVPEDRDLPARARRLDLLGRVLQGTFSIPPTTYTNDGWVSLANQAFPYAAITTNAAASAGSTEVTLSSVTGLVPGLLVGLNTSGIAIIPAGEVVASVNSAGSSITLSSPLLGSLSSGTKLYFGTQTASSSSVESQRLAFNAFMRSSYASLGCYGLVDVDAVLADSSGKWRVDLGQASIDGVHPSAVLHQAVVNAGIVPVNSFIAQ